MDAQADKAAKFETLKVQSIKKGRWNKDMEDRIRRQLNFYPKPPEEDKPRYDYDYGKFPLDNGMIKEYFEGSVAQVKKVVKAISKSKKKGK